MRAVIIGGGIIGLASAYELRKRGASVVVLDQGQMGMGASWGNAGWIVPSFSGPLPEPGLTRTVLRLLFQRDSPLYIKPRPSLELLRWMWDFWRNCDRRAYEAGLRAVAAFNECTLELFDRWRTEGVEFEMHSEGLVFAFETRAALEHSLEVFELLRAYGYQPPTVLDTHGLQEIAPVLSSRVIGGFLVERERHVQPWSLVRGLVTRLEVDGVVLRPETRVTGFESLGRRVTAARTDAGLVEGDAFLLATGAWAGRLARDLGFRLPVEPAKGYSITIRKPAIELSSSLYLCEGKVAITPFADALRVAGTLELAGVSDAINQRRVEAIRRSTERFLLEWPAGEGEIVWGGMRPLTPDGLPVLGRAPNLDNVFVATAHNMLGVTMAPTTGVAMAELMCTGESVSDLRPFDPARFTR